MEASHPAGASVNPQIISWQLWAAPVDQDHLSAFTHRELPEVFTFARGLPGRLAPSAQLVVEPHEQVPDGLGAGDDVERRRQRATLVKVTHPELGASKLPLDVSVVLPVRKDTFKLQMYW